MIPKTHNGVPFKHLKKCFIDFEYNRTTQRFLNLVSMTLADEDDGLQKIWLHGSDEQKAIAKDLLLSKRDTHIFVAFNVVAEASSFIALRLNPAKFAWIDIQLEYKMLLNHNHKFQYGKQLIGGKVKKTTPPPRNSWDLTEEQRKQLDSSKPEKSLAAACFRMLGKQIDTEHKDRMRDLILSDPEVFPDADREAILQYNASDVEVLPDLFRAIISAYKASPAKNHITYPEMAWRGQSAARAALIEKTGYPVNPERVKNFAKAVPSILSDICTDINRQFPQEKIFVWDKKRMSYSMKQRPLKEFIVQSPHADRWLRTDKGDFSLSLDAWAKFYDYKHDYPRDNLPAQILRFLKTKQSLNGFMPATGGRRNFFSSLGPDGRARAYLNPYGSQSSRFQPQATGFIPLKAAWMRSLIEPTKGRVIATIDYGSQEFLISALLSKDRKMYESYASGDPYLSFAKLVGAVPKDGTKDSHPRERTRMKSTVLGISYLMACHALSLKLTQDTGEVHTPEQAQGLIDSFFEVYRGYANWIDETNFNYNRYGFLKLPDGWVMFGDNHNHRSVSNCPVQGTGGVVLRKAIQLCQDAGLSVIIPLHDALYIELDAGDLDKIDDLKRLMLDAFCHYFDGEQREWAKAIRMDADVWGPDLQDGEITTPGGLKVKTQKIYIDPRAKSEYDRFSKYF